jgi:hypothetical protein
MSAVAVIVQPNLAFSSTDIIGRLEAYDTIVVIDVGGRFSKDGTSIDDCNFDTFCLDTPNQQTLFQALMAIEPSISRLNSASL